MRTRSAVLLAGDPGVHQTLAAMRQLVISEAPSIPVRTLAARIVARLPPRNGTAHAVAIRRFLSKRVKFLRDPFGTELLHGPAWLATRILTDGAVQVDCDDTAVLAAALGRAVGLRSRFTVVGFFSPKNPYRHVYAELSDPTESTWVEQDVTRPAQGLADAIIARRLTVDV